MILDDPLMYDQLLELNKQSTKPVHWRYVAEFLIGDTIIPTHNVLSIDSKGNYVSSISDYLFITVELYRSVHLTILESNSNELQLRIHRIANTTLGDSNSTAISDTITYDAFLVDNTNESLLSPSGGDTGNTIDDLSDTVTATIHLVEVGISEYRLMETTGIYKAMTPGDLLLGLMAQPFPGLQGNGYAITLHPPDNTDVKYQMSIGAGVKLVDLPKYLQDRYGLYSTGIGYYLKYGNWFIYPLLDYTRFDQSKRRLTIVNVPVSEMVGSDNTYIHQGEDIYVFATGDSKHIDESQKSVVNNGTGIRYARSGNLLDNFVNHAGGVTVIEPGDNRVDINMDTRAGGFVNNRSTATGFSSNPWSNTSDIVAGLGSVVLLPWESSNPELLYPGMPVKVIYKRNGELRSVMGVLIGVDTVIGTRQHSTTDNRYTSTSMLSIKCASISD